VAASMVARNASDEGATPDGFGIDFIGEHLHYLVGRECKLSTGPDGHSGKIGVTTTGRDIFGLYERDSVHPDLDACGGHYGITPGSEVWSYHFHFSDRPPFTVGCYGPNADGSIVTQAQCRKLYAGCASAVLSLPVQVGETWPKASSGSRQCVRACS
jgi:hypothetical protein